MNVLVAGGGSGGHLYPALAVMQALRQDPRIKRIGYIGTRRGLEGRIIPRYGFIEFFPIRVRGFERRLSLRNFLALCELAFGLLQTLFILWRFRPKLIIGMGGYASFPPLFCGVLLRIKTVIHEQNYFPGLVNRLMAPRVDKVLLAYSETARFLKAKEAAVVGIPIRREILEAQKNYERLGLDPAQKTLLVIGGSKGSATLTRHMLSCSRELKDLQVLLITGRQEPHERAPQKSANVITKEYIDDMGSALACADLVICRAGASTLAELLALEKPAIVIPWTGAAENHQHWNARSLLILAKRESSTSVNQERYRVLEEAQLEKQSLLCAIRGLLANANGHLGQSAVTALMRNSTRLFLKEVEPFLEDVSMLASWHVHTGRHQNAAAPPC